MNNKKTGKDQGQFLLSLQFLNKNSNLVQLAFRSEVKEKPGYFFFDLTLVGNLALVHFTRPDLSQSVCLNMHLAAAHLYRDK